MNWLSETLAAIADPTRRAHIALTLLLLSSAFGKTLATSHYANVHGLRMYYEIHDQGKPLVLLHGGGSSIQTTFGKVLPAFSESHQVIAIEQQGHGHTADIDRPFRFESMADDTAELLRHLKIGKADIFGFSNGGTVALQLALRHPSQVQRLVLASAIYNMDGVPTRFFYTETTILAWIIFWL